MSFSGIQSALDSAVTAGRVAGAVALVTDRRGVLHEAAAGLASTAGELPMTLDTVFYVASMTKPVTSGSAQTLGSRSDRAGRLSVG